MSERYLHTNETILEELKAKYCTLSSSVVLLSEGKEHADPFDILRLCALNESSVNECLLYRSKKKVCQV